MVVDVQVGIDGAGVLGLGGERQKMTKILKARFQLVNVRFKLMASS